MIIMLVRAVTRSINHACSAYRIPSFLPYATLIPLGFLLSRSLTQSHQTPRMPPIPKKEDEIFTHIAGDTEGSVDRVRTMIKDNPACLLSHDRRGRLPLHAFCQQAHLRRDVFHALIGANPDTASITDKFFSALPLHMAVHHDTQDIEILQDLINVYPEALLVADGGGFIPLHRAINRKVPDIEVIKLLLQRAPQSVKIKTTNGNLPLHWVVLQDPPSQEAVELLYNVYPEAVHVNNAKEVTPLDILLESGTSKTAALGYILQNLQ